MNLIKSFVCGLAIAALLAGNAQADLIGHYTFDGSVAGAELDSATADGSQDSATNSGVVGRVAGKIGNAGDFDTSNDLVIAAPFGITNAFTVSAWFNSDSQGGGYKGIFSSRGTANGSNFGLNTEPDAVGTRRFDYRYDNPTPLTGSVGKDSADNTARLGEWEHIAMTWRNDGTGEYYLNGAQIGTATGAATLYNDDGGIQWFIGGDINRRPDGQIDDVAMFNTALSETDIAAIFNGGNAGLNAAQVFAVPEPTSAGLALLGLVGLVARRRRS